MRGRPFQPGNKFGRGRPPGSRNRIRREVQRLLEEYEAPLIRKTIAMALQGDVQALRILFNLLSKDKPVKISAQPMETMEQLSEAQRLLLKKVAGGQIPATQGKHIDDLLESRRRIVETVEMEKRLQALEQAQQD